MVLAYDRAYQSILALEHICVSKDSRLEQLASAAHISLELRGVQLESAMAQLDALLCRVSELKISETETIAIRDATLHSMINVTAYAREQPSVFQRIEKKYGDLSARIIKP